MDKCSGNLLKGKKNSRKLQAKQITTEIEDIFRNFKTISKNLEKKRNQKG